MGRRSVCRRSHKIGIVFEGRVGKGKLLVCGFDVPRTTGDPAARQWLASMYRREVIHMQN